MRVCKFETCKNKHDSHGYCANHARQYRKYGHPLSKQEKFERQSKAATKRLLKYYAENPDRPKRSWSAEKREAAKGICKNTGRTHFKKGHPSWNKGTVGLTSAWNKGTKGVVKAWNKGIPMPQMRGENNPNWKGGTTKERSAAMGRVEYRLWREEVFARDNYTCQVCSQYGGHLHADHIETWKDSPELRYLASNGRTLCVPCHYYVTFKRKMPIGAVWCNYRLTRKRG